MKVRTTVGLIVVGLAFAGPPALLADHVGSAFTYQGELINKGTSVNGDCDFQFSLWDAVTLGTQIGPTLTFDGGFGNSLPITLTDGRFTVALDFGDDRFQGSPRFLKIEVCCPTGCAPGFTTLAPRQELTPTPYALALPGLRTTPSGSVEFPDSPNVIGGHHDNRVAPLVAGAGPLVASVGPLFAGGVIGGGGAQFKFNQVTGNFGTIGGGRGNIAGVKATVGGGFMNTASGEEATVGGGFMNTASDQKATVGGGGFNTAIGPASTVGGGFNNAASELSSTIGGGNNNMAGGNFSTVGGGFLNKATGGEATVCGGSDNTAGFNATVGGGSGNKADANRATVGGGSNNTAAGVSSTIGGGISNTTISDFNFGSFATIGGGEGNIASASHATVGGGQGNFVIGVFGVPASFGTIGGGLSNDASGEKSTIGGGFKNSASGLCSVVPGGCNVTAAGANSFAAGTRANAQHDGSFVWADTSSDQVFSSKRDNEFCIRATGGTRVVSAVDGTGEPTVVVALKPGAGAWSASSSRSVKDNFEPVNVRTVLEGVAALPIETWNYTTQDSSVRHIGPMSQDFQAAFGVGEDEKFISTIDADGVALAAIQGLYQMLQEKEACIAEQQSQIAEQQLQMSEQRSQMVDLTARLKRMEAAMAQLTTAHQGGAR